MLVHTEWSCVDRSFTFSALISEEDGLYESTVLELFLRGEIDLGGHSATL